MKVEEDTCFSGRIDRVRHYRRGVIGAGLKAMATGDGFMETCTHYKKGSIDTQTQDGNKDGYVDITILF